jgi:hypothetical protein
MGRIGKCYPRFQPSEQASPRAPAQSREASASPVLGALVGVLSALGLIGWLLSR